jgi:hypothetical protein
MRDRKEDEMERSRRRTGLRLTGAVAAALCAALVAATPASAGQLSEWVAELPAQDGSSWIDFKVKAKKNKQTKKFRPVAIKKLSVNFLEMNCSDGERAQTSFTWGILKTNPGVPDEIPVSNRRFSFSVGNERQTANGPESFNFTVSGRVPRNGPPTGTLRFKSTGPQLIAPPYDPGPDPENPAPVPPSYWAQVTCDTGSVHWTGKRLPDGTL